MSEAHLERDIVLKLGHQSQCFRICEYHKLRNQLHMFEEGFGHTAVELGPHTNKLGPELVLLKGVTASPDVLLGWLATPHMRGMCTRMYSLHPDAHPLQTKEDLLKELLCHPVPSDPVRLQCHPRSLEEYLQDGLPKWSFHPRHFGSVLHCVELDGLYHFALNSKRDSYLYAPPKEALARHAACCRARKKLEEVFTALGMLTQQFGLAIDIGAAPGGWTSFLAERCTRVLAVDPAEMNSAALRKNVTHLRSSLVACKHCE
ncbi:g1272 [Coccomyxa elongata]